MNKHTNPNIATKERHKRKHHCDRGIEIGSVLVILFVCVVIGGAVFFVHQQLRTGENITQRADNAVTIKPQKLNKKQLEELIDNAKSIKTEAYTEESVQELSIAVERGQTILNGIPEQNEIEESYIEIINAIHGLTKKDT